MPRKATLLNSLARGRVRASWNKYNLFNLYKKGRVNFQGQNLYQQKWTAKQETRAYHGEHLTEKRFQANFSQKLESVAHLDASLRGENDIPTPVPLQTYAVLEKRLDFALFRSMFASSVRQARQFILHGYVKVNGICIRQPGYTLQEGDIFNVRPDKVLLALGATKPSVKEAVRVDSVQIAKWNDFVLRAKTNPKEVWEQQMQKRQLKGMDEVEKKALEQSIRDFNNKLEKKMIQEQKQFTAAKALKTVLQLGIKEEAPTVDTFKSRFSPEVSEKAYKLYQTITTSKEFTPETLKTTSPKDLDTLVAKALDTELNKTRPEAEKKFYSEVKQLVASIKNMHHENLRLTAETKKIADDAKTMPYDPKWADSLKYHDRLDKAAVLEDESAAKVSLPWQKGLFGRQEKSKPYFTPWKVRPFIAPFAILPSHIEVSFETCHAVYMRDPVALPGKSEVISPFALPVHERAYMWYIRRAKASKN